MIIKQLEIFADADRYPSSSPHLEDISYQKCWQHKQFHLKNCERLLFQYGAIPHWLEMKEQGSSMGSIKHVLKNIL